MSFCITKEYAELKKDSPAYAAVYLMTVCLFFFIGMMLGELHTGTVERLYHFGGVAVSASIFVASAVSIRHNWHSSKMLCGVLAAFALSTAARHLTLFPEMVYWILTDLAIVFLMLFVVFRSKYCR